MKKSSLLILAGVLSTGFVFAGGIENKTNMSTGYLRNPSRNVEAERPEAAFYNIAGTGFMKDGLYLEAGNQFIFKEYSNTLATNALASSGLADGTKYNDETTVFLYPNLDVVYKTGSFAFFGNFGIYAGGGKLEYSEGTAATSLAFLGKAGEFRAKAQAAASAGQTAAYNIYRDMAGNFGYAAKNHSLTINSITYGEQLGAAYNIKNIVSVSAAIRFLEGTQRLELTSPYFNTISRGEGNEVSCDSFAFGVSPVLGVHVRPIDGLDVAAQIQVKTEMEYEVSNLKGKTIAAGIGPKGIKDDTTYHTDIPTVLNLGVGYRVMEPLYISSSFNYYFNRSAECNSIIGTNDYNDSFEIAAGADYTFNKFVTVSSGVAYGKQGVTNTSNNIFNPVLDSMQVGFGAEVTPLKQLTVTAGGTYVYYFPTDYYVNGSYKTELNKKLFMLSLGVTYRPF